MLTKKIFIVSFILIMPLFTLGCGPKNTVSDKNNIQEQEKNDSENQKIIQENSATATTNVQ